MMAVATGNLNQPTDAELLEAAQLGSETAFGRLIERHFGTIYAVAYARMGHRETAEDLAQETFLRAFVCLEKLKESRRFIPWLVRIAHNLATDWQRQARLTTMVPVEEVAMVLTGERTKDAREVAGDEEQHRVVREAIFQLPPEQREVVLLHYMENLSQKEIAERMDTHSVAVHRLLKRAMANMKESLEPVIRETAKTMTPQHKAVIRTTAFVVAIGAMSASTKSAMAKTAALVAEQSLASLSAAGSASLPVKLLGLLKSIPVVGSIMPETGPGGIVMGLKAKVAVSLVVAAIAAGGGTYVYRQRTAIAAGGISGPAQIRTDGVSQSDAWEVQQAFSKYQQACKNRDMNGYVTAFDASSRSQINATELPAKEPEMLDMIAAAKIDRMVQANATSRMLKRDVIRASDGDLKWFFAKSPEGWKIVNQKFNYDSGALLDLIRRQRQHDPQGAIQVPDRTSSSEEIDAIKKAFRRYQKAARARDGEATADLMDLEMLGLMTGETPAQIRDEIIRFSGSAQGLWQASENVRIDSVKIRKTVKYSDEWLDMANARNPHSGIDKIPKGKGPYYFLCADDLAFYYRKTPEGWKLISSNLDVD